MDRLTDWTYQEGENYSQLQELYNNVVTQWGRYTGHVVANIGGVVQTRKRQGQRGVPFEMVPEDKQKRAMDYLDRQVFSTPGVDAGRGTSSTGSRAPERWTRWPGRQSSALNQVLNVTAHEAPRGAGGVPRQPGLHAGRDA